LTPERASSTLSRMYCEKLKLMPGNSLNFGLVQPWVSIFLTAAVCPGV
jgi:hypothetical protein